MASKIVQHSCESSLTAAEPSNVQVRLNAPVRNLTMLELHQKAGVEEIYAGVAPLNDTRYSFDSLPLIRGGESCHFPSFKALSRLIKIAEEQDTIVHFAADAPCLPSHLEHEWMEHVSSAIEAGVSTVVVGTLAALRMAVKLAQGTNVKVVASPVMGVSTTYMAKYIVGEGVRRIITPHELCLSEIEKIIHTCGVEVEVPVQTGASIDISRSRLSDIQGVGLACRAGWSSDEKEDTLVGPGILDGAGDCAFCDVPALIDMGVTAFNLSGRESPNLKQNAKITQMYRRAIKGMSVGTSMDRVIADIDRIELTWQMGWVPRLCEQQRCRFQETPRTKAYV